MPQSSNLQMFMVAQNMPLDHIAPLRYRPEIDGLRALAVLSVIFFHAGVSVIPGGFTGVDIFYVISGFLITNIILTAIGQNTFSLSGFYARRIKRILPAVFFMLLAAMVFGYFILTPDQYLNLAESAIYTSFFLANVWFAKTTGYFDQSTDISPLVHMWSLAVEEQFYLMFPLLVACVHFLWGRKGIKVSIIVLFLASLLLSIFLTARYPNFSFYLLPTRAWELCAGALLALFPLQELKIGAAHFISSLGLAVVAFGLVFISQEQAYPGWLALIPVVGTVLLIISAHTEKSIGHRVLSYPPVVFVGRFSYSAYLWHWPIVSFYRIYVSEREFVFIEVVLLVIASLFAGFLSWKLIEERFRYIQLATTKTMLFGALSIGVMTIVPVTVLLKQGFPGRVSSDDQSITDNALMGKFECAEKIALFEEEDTPLNCVIGAKWDTATTRGILWGDSHSEHFRPLIHQLASQRNMSFLATNPECPSYLDANLVKEHWPEYPDYTEECTRRNRKIVTWLSENTDVEIVIVAAAWSGHIGSLYTEEQPYNNSNSPRIFDKSREVGGRLSESALEKTLESIQSKNRHVLLLGDMPRPNRNLNECAFSDTTWLLRSKCSRPYQFLDAKEVKAFHKVSDKVLIDVASLNDKTHAILPTEKLCNREQCPTFLSGELIYRDTNHIRLNLSYPILEELGDKLGLPEYLDSIR